MASAVTEGATQEEEQHGRGRDRAGGGRGGGTFLSVPVTDNRWGGDKEAAGDMPVVVEEEVGGGGVEAGNDRGSPSTKQRGVKEAGGKRRRVEVFEIHINKAGKDAAREPGGDGQDWEAANQGLNEEEGDVLEVGGKFLDTGQGGKGGT